MDNKIIYKIDNKSFFDYNVIIEKSEGILGFPVRKDNLCTDYPNINGQIVDTDNVFFKEREITLTGHIIASSRQQLVNLTNEFENILFGAGLHQLTIQIQNQMTLIYYVYTKDNLNIEKKWRNGNLQCSDFTLKLIEPNPIKKILSFVPTSSQPKFLYSCECDTDEVFQIFYDTAKPSEVVGKSIEVERIFSEEHFDKEIKICICGNINSMSNISTNAQIIFDKI